LCPLLTHTKNGNVSIHAPAWGATKWMREKEPDSIVSIHAPAWGATAVLRLAAGEKWVSIHAPAWGATVKRIEERIKLVKFQSTRPRGARHLCVFKKRTRSEVSIHAPAWGATLRRSRLSLSLSGFNPRARVGRDVGTSRFWINNIRFQSTRPRGARRARNKVCREP